VLVFLERPAATTNPGQEKGWGVRWCGPDQEATTMPKVPDWDATWTAVRILQSAASGQPARLKLKEWI